ncbi:MAG TPA: DUF5317 family protein [Dehalococcoidia bacterium]|nr:DUF5317 family protein [Dehalococcoidia bacterium]
MRRAELSSPDTFRCYRHRAGGNRSGRGRAVHVAVARRSVQAGGPLSRPAPGIRWLGLAAGAFLVQVAVVYGLGSLNGSRSWFPLLVALAHFLLLPFLLRNLSFWGIRLVLVGLVLNLTAMLANGGLMPVDGGAVNAVGGSRAEGIEAGAPIPRTKNVLLPADAIRLRELSDRLVLPVPKPFTRAVSLGDILVVAGVAITGGEILIRAKARQGEGAS